MKICKILSGPKYLQKMTDVELERGNEEMEFEGIEEFIKEVNKLLSSYSKTFPGTFESFREKN